MHNLIIKKIWNVIQFKRGTVMPRLHLEVVGNLGYRCGQRPTQTRENHYAILVSCLKISYVPKRQDAHNASLFFNMSPASKILPTSQK